MTLVIKEVRADKVNRFLENLSQEGLYQVAQQLMLYPESRAYFLKCAHEFAVNYPIMRDAHVDRTR